jgi:hypothetical protein
MKALLKDRDFLVSPENTFQLQIEMFSLTIGELFGVE